MPIPLRLRRRRDGSLVLTNGVGMVLTPDSELKDSVLPAEHLFLYTWLNGEGARVARVEYTDTGRVIKLALANATALYEVEEDQEAQVATLVRQGDHKGSLMALAPERRDAVGAALAAQGILASLVGFEVTEPAPIAEEPEENIAVKKAEAEKAASD